MAHKNEEPDEKVINLAEKIKVLFAFAHGLAPDMELLKEAFLGAKNKESFSVSAAPILGAFGIDYEQKEFEWALRRKRVEALINLIEVLENTEKERSERNVKQASYREIAESFGL
jgi:hypothetical protein